MKSSQGNKAKRKQHRKALRESEPKAQLKKKKTIEKWLKDYYESRTDYPVTKSKKRLTWKDYKKAFGK